MAIEEATTPRDSRLIAALVVGAIPPVVVYVLVTGLLGYSQFAGEAQELPASFVLFVSGWFLVPMYIFSASALLATTELLALFGHPTARRVHLAALLPGALLAWLLLDSANLSLNGFMPSTVIAIGLVPVLAYQGLLRAWWGLAKRLAEPPR